MKYVLKDLPEIGDVKKFFFVGIKGVGVAPLALIAKDAGFDVMGSDVGDSFITDVHLKKREIPISVGFEVSDIESFFDKTLPSDSLIITTGAHKGFENPQVVYGKKKNITILTQGQALAVFMKGEIIGREIKGISIAGSHGKTTITALLATTMKAMGLDPSYAVGTGELFPLGAPGYLGRGRYFIAEADEYSSEPVHDRVPKFLYQHPDYAIFNNIDFDHPDLFENIDEVELAFEEFAYNIQSGGILFVNGDDQRLVKFKEKIKKDVKIITYGTNSGNDYVAVKIVTQNNATKFTVLKNGHEIGVFNVNLKGDYNAKNALAVVSLLTEFGYKADEIKPCLAVFEGSKRRSELVGIMRSGAMVIDDYGHHPLEISMTIQALKDSYKDKKIICVFQSHTYSRTKIMLEDFGKSFSQVHKLLLLPVFKSARDVGSDTLTNEEIIKSHKKYADTDFFENFSDVIEYINQNYSSDEYLILTIGAGDVYKIGQELVKNN